MAAMPAVLASRTTFFALCLIPEAIASLLTVALPKSPKAVLHWALGVGEEAIAGSHPTLYSPGGPIRHWTLGIG